MRANFDYQGFPAAVAVLKISTRVIVRPNELRITEWSDTVLNCKSVC